MAIVEVSIVPLGTNTTSVSQYVAAVLEVLEKSGLKYQLTSMGTIIEGDLDEILKVVRQMHEVPFQKEVKRVVTTIRIDDRRDRQASIEGKVRSVREKLNK